MIIRTDTLVAGYNMIPSGSTLTDQSVNEYDGTITDATYQRTLYGDALTFNGTTAKVTTSNGPLADNSHTIAFWIYPRDVATSQYIVSNGSIVGSVRLNVTINILGNLSYFYGSSGGSKSVSDAITGDTWTHVVITRDFDGANTTAKLYLNGINVDSDVSAVTPGVTDTDLILGCRSSSDFFDGLLVDPQIYNEAKDSTWVLWQYNLKREEVQKNTSRLLSQFSDATKLQALVQVFSAELEEINECIENMRDTTNVNDAYAEWLDNIGRIIGLNRPFKQQPYATCFAFKEDEDDVDDWWKGFYISCLP